jgi:hypothetical protein
MIKIGIFAISLGLIVLAAFQLIGSAIDANGTRREPFGLLPIGFALLIGGAVTTLTGLIRRKVKGPPRD